MREHYPFWLGGSNLSGSPVRKYRNVKRANLRIVPAADTMRAIAQRSAADLDVEALESDAASAHVGEWRDLILRALEPNVFYDPAFALAAAQHLPGWQRPRFVFVWDGHGKPQRELIAVCPMLFSGPLPGGFVRSWVHKQSALGTPLLDRRRAKQALDALIAFCGKAAPGAAGVLLPRLPLDGKTAGLLRAKAIALESNLEVLDAHERAILSHGVDPVAFFGQSLSPKRLRKLERARHRLAMQSDLHFRMVHDTSEIRTATELFLSLEAKGWKGKRGTALVCAPQTATFARTLVRSLAGEGRLAIASLDLAGIPIAMAILLSSGQHSYAWKIAYDEDFASYSPGVQLMLEVTRAQLARPETTMTDSCAVAGHPMIDKLWPERISIGDVCLPLRSGRTGVFGGALARESLKRKIRVGLRNLVAGLR